ncbi:MAG: hypothetical protein SVU32_07420 [Candidatus Nanohaloarchaea archaeon]|nr:hypothetical protein [Candidatus Nanohaloarchaea archaeon]
MSGPAESKHRLENATVYIHRKDEDTNSQAIHIDIEHPDLNEIIEPGENTFCGGKDGGVFLGLKDRMQDRARDFVDRQEE